MGTYWSLISDSIFFDTSLNYSLNNADNNGPIETEYKSSFDSNNLSLSVSSGLNMNFYDKLFITQKFLFYQVHIIEIDIQILLLFKG